jgi:hypothetical protein
MHRNVSGVVSEGSHLYSFEGQWSPHGEHAVWTAVVRDESGRAIAHPSGEANMKLGNSSPAQCVRSQVEIAILRLRRGPSS